MNHPYELTRNARSTSEFFVEQNPAPRPPVHFYPPASVHATSGTSSVSLTLGGMMEPQREAALLYLDNVVAGRTSTVSFTLGRLMEPQREAAPYLDNFGASGTRSFSFSLERLKERTTQIEAAVFLDDVAVEIPSLREWLFIKQVLSKQTQDRVVRAIQDRVNLLVRQGIDEEITANKASQQDLYDFMEMLGRFRKPSIFLTDDGNFRAVWRADEEQVALQFLGNKRIQYVIFYYDGAGSILRRAGVKTFHDVNRLIGDWQLDRLIR